VIAEVEEREVMLGVLRSQVEEAVDAEDFRAAASLQEAVKELEAQDDMSARLHGAQGALNQRIMLTRHT